ncbi:SDR family NAD(P)-dependent oxidoreductase [Variovorax sp. YR216]|uniref:SDR family NAD(P)-dependent oxidoreductase n=1 Tax=Variovorax sp. YR216 TaxID=1882828 RepID=UPI0008998D70|nr:SDR family oxidoreductase [Variovorax sp. YR216]SEB20592.1 short chain dehydrogenase [Variovorax sp. YR216]
MTMGAVIVTGGTFGLGQSITVELARRGHRVVAFGLAQPQVSSTAQGFDSLLAELEAAGCTADVLEADVSDADEVQRVVEHTIGKYGTIHGLVNNAAVGPLGTVLTTDEPTFERIVDVNLKGTYLMSRAVLPHMIEAGGGSIVNIGSGAGYGKPNMAIYSASKGAIVALSTAMAYDHFHDHVRVNVAIPGGGGIVSGMSVGRMGGDLDAFRSKPVSGTVAGRPATGRDLANAVAFLLSDDAAAISGTVIDVGCFAHQGGPIPSLSPKH